MSDNGPRDGGRQQPNPPQPEPALPPYEPDHSLIDYGKRDGTDKTETKRR
jgi:hypothetical protein